MAEWWDNGINLNYNHCYRNYDWLDSLSLTWSAISSTSRASISSELLCWCRRCFRFVDGVRRKSGGLIWLNVKLITVIAFWRFCFRLPGRSWENSGLWFIPISVRVISRHVIARSERRFPRWARRWSIRFQTLAWFFYNLHILERIF